jgi:hypothetical protein
MHEMGFGSEAKQQRRGGTAATQQHGDAADKRGGGGTNRTKRRNKNATMRRGKMNRSWGLQGKLSAQRVLERSLGSLGRGVLQTTALVQCNAGCGRLQQRESLAGGALVCFEPKDALGCRRSSRSVRPSGPSPVLHSGQATKPRAQARQQRWA